MNADLITLILAASEVTDIAEQRVTWQAAAQAPLTGHPYAVLTRTSGAVGFTHDGLSRLDVARVQADCFAPTYAQAVALRDAITGAICGQQGITGSTDFRAIVPNTPRDFTPVNGLHRCLGDFSVTYRPAPPSP